MNRAGSSIAHRAYAFASAMPLDNLGQVPFTLRSRGSAHSGFACYQ